MPVYQDSIATELAFVLEHAEVAIIVAEDQEQVDKILSLKERLPHLRLLGYENPLGLAQYDIPFLRAFDDIDAEGRKFAEAHPGYVEAELEKDSSDEIALLRCRRRAAKGLKSGNRRTRRPTVDNATGRVVSMLGPQRMQHLPSQLAGPFLVGRHKKRTPSSSMLGGSLSRCLKCGLLGRAARGVGGWGRRSAEPVALDAL